MDGLWEGSGLASEGGLLVEGKGVASDEPLVCQVYGRYRVCGGTS